MLGHFKKSASILTDKKTQMFGNDRWPVTICNTLQSHFEAINEINLPSLGHAATNGCSRCNKLFPGTVGSKNYGGFENPDSWPKRTTIEHREEMSEILDCTTGQDRERLESEFGTRFSVLAGLPYSDTVRMSLVDPMHNLCLGTAKNILKIWKERAYLQKNELEQLQEKVD